jgi:glycosyltransferase involved in cell wall biosynthesis
VRAVGRLAGVIPGLKFVIYPRFADGEGKPLADVKRIVAEEGLESIVEFRPPVPLEQVPAEMARANVGVFTPHLDVHIDIALSLKVPEYVAMSLPIVTTRTRIMDCYFTEDQVGYFDDGDVAGCAAAIRRIHDDPGAARAMAARADRFLEEHSWSLERARYFALLQGLLPGEKPITLPAIAGDVTAGRIPPGRQPAAEPAGSTPTRTPH